MGETGFKTHITSRNNFNGEFLFYFAQIIFEKWLKIVFLTSVLNYLGAQIPRIECIQKLAVIENIPLFH